MKPRFSLPILTFLLALPPIARADDAATEALTAYFPFENSTAPLVAKGAKIAENTPVFTFALGKIGQALVVAGKELPLPSAGNFERPAGSLAFWVRPSWSPKDAEKGQHILFKLTNFQVSYFANSRRLLFMTGKTKVGEGFKWDYSVGSGVPSNWKAGEWHHIAVTWDAKSGQKAIYLDGQPAATGQTDLIRDDADIKDMALGSPETPGEYDELAIWNRILTPKQIAFVAAATTPIAAAPVVVAGAPQGWPVRFSLAMSQKPVETIVAPGQSYAATFPVENTGKTAFQGTLQLDLLDFWEKSRAQQTLPLALAPGEKRELKASFVAPENGVFKVAARLRSGGKSWERDLASFAAWPVTKGAPNPESFFGNHINAYYGGDFLDQGARLGQGWARAHNMLQSTWWPRVQSEPGAFEWTQDAQIEAHRARKMPVLGQFFGTPYWAAASGPLPPQAPGAYPYNAVPKMDLLREYVKQTVSHYGETISVWEVGNEPDVSKFWGGSPEEFAEYSQVALKAAREIAPKSTLLVGGFTSPAWQWHEATARAGAFKGADAISFHYGCPLIAPEENYAQLSATVAHFDKLSREFGPGRALPLWSTEGSTPDSTWLRGLDFEQLPPENARAPMSWRLGAIRTVQGSAILQMLGVKRHFMYMQTPIAPGASSYENVSMLEVTRSPRPKLMARVAMAAQLDGSQFKGEFRAPQGRVWATVYEKKSGGSVVLWWAGDGAKVSAAVKWPVAPARVVDIMGNAAPALARTQISDEPTYLHIAAPAARVLEAIRAAKFTVQTAPAPLLTAQGAEAPRLSPLPDYVAPGEAPDKVFFVDLRRVANAGLADEKTGDGLGGWTDEGPFNDLRELPTGKRTLAGVPFEILDPAQNGGRAVVTLRGSVTTPKFPEKVENIAVGGRKARTLYFLQAASWSGATKIGRYIVHFQDGQTAEIPVVSGQNTGNWWTGYVAGESSRPIPVRVNGTVTGQSAWRYLRAFEWVNPRPDTPIERLDFVSENTPQSPILLAVTGVAGF